MEDIKSLVSVIAKNKVKQIDIIGNSDSGDTQVQKLYEGIVDNTIQDEEDIISLFFPGSKYATLYSSRLKSKLRSRLINTLFFIDVNQPDFNEYNRAYYTCYKQLAATKILIGRAARQAAMPLAEKALEQALNFEFTDIVLFLAKDLRMHYGTIMGDKKRFEDLNALIEEYTNIFFAELKAEKNYASLSMNYARSRATKLDLVKDAEKYTEELEELMPVIKSYRFNYLAFLIFTLRYEIANDYANTLKVCQKALHFFESKNQMVSITTLFSFNWKILICLIHLKNYSEAKNAVPKCLSYARVGSPNWFSTLDFVMILSFHASDFQEAYKTYKQASTHPEFKKQQPIFFEQWRIYEAYTFYLILLKKIMPDENNPLKTFRVNKFLNEVPIYSKDKRGVNISIIILQILFLLQQRRYGDIIDRVESLKAYTQRYLRQDDTFRSHCFIQMLLTLPECSFHKKAVLRKAEKYLKKLHEVPLNIANQSAEIEIIPYEMLWEFILESLDEKWH